MKVLTTSDSLSKSGSHAAAREPDWEARPPNWVCPECGYEVRPSWDSRPGVWREPYIKEGCPQCNMQELTKIARRDIQAAVLRKYNLDSGEYAEMRFDTYKPKNESQQQALWYAQAVVRAWEDGDWSKGMLLSSGDVGIGKTHLAIATAYEGVIRYPTVGDRVLADWTMPEYVDAMKDVYDD